MLYVKGVPQFFALIQFLYLIVIAEYREEHKACSGVTSLKLWRSGSLGGGGGGGADTAGGVPGGVGVVS